jgi:hypothetical protein
MANRLQEILATTRESILSELAAAEAELEVLRASTRDLEMTIARARAALAAADTTRALDADAITVHRSITLHQAMAHVLAASETGCLTAPQLRKAITAAGLFHRRGNAPVELQQIHARVSNYPKWFERRHGGICLKPGAPGAPAPKDASIEPPKGTH